MHAHEALIHRFYGCFQARDAAGMQACYHPELTFRDPAFGELDAAQAGAMWHMLCTRATDLDIELSAVRADATQGSAHWNARYTFGQTGRPVVNRIDASFLFRDGLIVRHEDHFDFWRWSRQALGTPGMLLGWSGMLRNRVHATAHRSLHKFMHDDPPGGTGTPPTS